LFDRHQVSVAFSTRKFERCCHGGHHSFAYT
jgi:hypothetical protein